MTTLIIFILILGTLVFVHELGHFVMAKRAGVHIYEFALGFGPKIWSKVGKKDKVVYSIRMLPIGGFVQIAGEVYEDDNKIPKDKLMVNKSWGSRLSIMVAGVFNNFLLALIILFIYALGWGYTEQKAIIGSVVENYPAEKSGIEAGDKILAVNGKKTDTWNVLLLRINMKDKDDAYSFLVEKADGREITYKLSPIKELNEKEEEVRVFGFTASKKEYSGFVNAIKYAFSQFASIIDTMLITLGGLFNGSLSLNSFAGPVGIYSIVGETAKYGLGNILYLVALLSINLGFINILPFPAFDGGKVLFLILAKLLGKPINQKIENAMHTIFFVLLMALMLYITFQDILRLF